jgi:deoxyribose-phosphate aldolase
MSQHYFERLIEEAAVQLSSRPLHPVVDVESLTNDKLAGLIDHTLLKPEAGTEQILTLCQEAQRYQFASVCVNPGWVPLCVEQLEGANVLICSVVGFPLGANTTETKIIEAEELVSLGAHEIDMVINIGRLKDRDYTYVYEDILQVVDTCRGARIKVILENCLLTEQEKIAACILCREAGAHFVKTSTGMNKSGATIEDVALMRRVVGAEMGVKAAGGIRDYATAVAMLSAGANRIGTSASVEIVS